MFSFSTPLFLIITLNTCIIITQTSPPVASGLSLQCRVHMMNDLSNNDKLLIIHCQGGAHPLDEEWIQFQIPRKCLEITHFWCYMRLDLKETTVDVYRTYHETEKCQDTRNYFWSIREDGLYFGNHKKSWEKQ